MYITRTTWHWLIISPFLFFFLANCSPTPPPPERPVSLSLAMLPILDALPMYVAQEKGYFDSHNIVVEFIPVSSAAERDQIMAAGQADGIINDLVSVLFYNRDSIQIQVVRFARTATPQFPQYRILAAKDSGISHLDELKGVQIGVSEGSIISYTTDRLLEAEGFTEDDIQIIAVPNIADRLALLNSGQLRAANLPDPFSSLAIQEGASVILDDTTHPQFSSSVISFRKSVIEEEPEAIRGFLAALELAINDINSDPNQWEDFLVEHMLVPEPLIGAYKIPTFPPASLPTRSQWDDVVDWARSRGWITADVSFSDSVTSAFLP